MYSDAKLTKSRLVLVTILTSILAFVIVRTLAAIGPVVLYTNPAGTQLVTQDTIFTVDVRLSSAADVPITGAVVQMTYPTDKLQVDSIDYTGSPYGTVLHESNTAGVLRMDRAALPKVPGGDNLFVRVKFKAIATGSAPINFNANSFVTSGDDDSDLPMTRQGVTYTITPPPDTTAPVLSISSPANNATVANTIVATASATDNVAVAGVQFKLDGTNVGNEDTIAPYSHSLNTLTLANGPHTLVAVARDTSNNTATSTAVTINVQNADVTMPTVNITSPANNAVVSGAVTVAANATDNIGVTGVQFRVDGANIGTEDTTAPYSVSWNSLTLPNGNHVLTAIARDAANNTVTSTTATVNVQNADTTVPVVSITSPANGSTVSGTVSAAATATDNVGVVGVQFKVDGVDVGAEDTTSPYNASINTLPLTNGSHLLIAVARDAANNTTTSTSVILNVQNPDITAPTVSITSPANNAIVSGTITITATASDNIGVTGVQFRVDGASTGAEDTIGPYNLTLNTLTLPNGNHILGATARDAAGNTTNAGNIAVNVQNIDTQAPNAPTSLNGATTQPASDMASKVVLTWPVAIDNGSPASGIKGYYVYRGTTVISPLITSGTTYTDNNVPTGSYNYTVRSVDNVDLTSATASPSYSTTINVPIDTKAPPAPTGLTATAPLTTQVNLSWIASSDATTGNSGIAGYNVYRGTSPTAITTRVNQPTTQNPSGLVTTTSYGDVTVQHSTTYYYAIEAVDGASNASPRSAVATVSVPAPGDVTGAGGVSDGKIDLHDISYVIRFYESTNPRADFTGANGIPDGIVNLYDVSFIITRYTP